MTFVAVVLVQGTAFEMGKHAFSDPTCYFVLETVIYVISISAIQKGQSINDTPSLWILSIPCKSNHFLSIITRIPIPDILLTSSLLVAPPWTSWPTFLQYIIMRSFAPLLDQSFSNEKSRCISIGIGHLQSQ